MGNFLKYASNPYNNSFGEHHTKLTNRVFPKSIL